MVFHNVFYTYSKHHRSIFLKQNTFDSSQYGAIFAVGSAFFKAPASIPF
jgi:hypothetical protein